MKKTLNRILLLSLLILASLFFIFLVASLQIKRTVKDNCMVAINQYEGDCVDALIQVVDGDINTFEARNDAIWTLGQLSDQRAQKVLNKYYTNIIPTKEPYDDSLSQHELKKALKLVDGGFNLNRLIWSVDKVKSYNY